MLGSTLSSAEQIAVLVLQIGVIIFAAKFCGQLFAKLSLPSVLGELCAGILIGPYALGRMPLPLFGGLKEGLFGFVANPMVNGTMMENVTFQGYHTSLYALATIGSIILLFMSGLETNLKMFFRYSLAGTMTGLGGVIASFLLGDMVGQWMIPGAGFMDPRCLFLGILCTATSVGISARILSEKKKIDTPEGVTIMAAAVIDDVLGIICLAIVQGIVGSMASGESMPWSRLGLISLKCVAIWLGATLVGLALARYYAKFLRIFKSPAVFGTLAFGLALLVSGLFEAGGLSMIIGAYVVGLSLSKTDVSFAIQEAFHPVYMLLVPVFFVVMGMLIDVRVFTKPDVLKMGLIYSALAIAAKVIGCALPTLFMNFNVKGALRIGVGMVPRGEVALIIGGIGMTTMMMVNGVKTPILDSDLFGVAIIMTFATTLLAPPLLALALAIPGKGVRKETQDSAIILTPFDFPTPVIADAVFRRMQEIFSEEGYLMSAFDKESGILQLRKDNKSFTLVRKDTQFQFESTAEYVTFIKSVMFDTFVDLRQSIDKLKDFTDPAEIKKDLLTVPVVPAAPGQKKPSEPPAPLKTKSIRFDWIILDLKSETKQGIICEMLDALVNHTDAVTDSKLCLSDILEREKIVSTCLQNGIAIPHGRTDGTKRMVTCFGRAASGRSFDSIDGQPSKIFLLAVTPREGATPHLEFISGVASVLSNQANVDKLLAASTEQEVAAVFK